MKKKKHVLRKLITVFCAAVLSIGMLNAATVDETIQAEDYSSQSGCTVSTIKAGYTGSGFLDYGGDGTWGEWTYTSPGAGTITLSLRYGNGSADNRQCEVTVNGSSAGNVAFASTSSWTIWNTVTIDIDVVEGTNTIRIAANTSYGGPNLDKLDLDGTVGSGSISVTGVSVAPTTLTLDEGQTSDLTETVSPSNATDQSVTWSSSNTSVATVDANGLVTAVTAGSATITVTTNDGSFTANCAVTVNVPVISVTGVTVAPTTLTLDEGQTSDLTETVSPSNATDQSVAWSSSNASVATVNASGLVTAVAAGNATITVTTNDGNFTANCAVTVNEPSTQVTVDETIQAEDYSSQSGCAFSTNKAGYTGSGFLDYGGDGTWGEWTYTSPGNGTLTLSLRYGNGSSDNRQCEVTVNGSSAGNVAFASTGSWTVWNTVTIDIDVVEGTNAIRIAANTSYGGPNLDKLDLDGVVGGSGSVVSVTGVSVAPTSLALVEGQTSDLTETVSPANATDKSVTWASSNASVATVNASGLVTAVAAGNATITVTTNDGSFTANCAVTVSSSVVPVTGVSVAPTSLILVEGQTSDLTETVSPANATDQSVTWSSSNTSVATVNASGLVTAVAAGSATITVTTNDGSFTANCAVTVNTPSSGITSNATWQSFQVSTLTGLFTATFDAVPNGSGIDAVTGIQNGTASGYGDLACIVRFNSTGQIDARNGGSYAASNTVNYTAGTSYHFRLEINVSTHTYFVYVTPQGGSEQTVASNFAFRSEQASVAQLTGWSVYALSGSHTVSNMVFTPAPPDTEAPSVPTGLAASDITSLSFTLNWVASTDNVGVTGYEVFQDGVSLGTTANTSLPVTGLSASTTYSMTVSALDGAGNESAQSAALNVTTDIPDTQAPSIPTGLAASGIYSASFTLSWNASTDNIGVTGYEVFKDGVSIGTTTQPTKYVGGLSATTTYSMTVRATDLAGNWSAESAALNVTTSELSGDWPNASNTGPSGTLTPYSGDITVTTDNTVIENLHVSGKVVVRANNVTIRNCKMSAVDVRCDLPYTGCLVEDCEMNWAGRGNMTMRRCKMASESDDLVRISGGDFIIEDCYLHIDGPRQEGDHGDVIQAYPTETYNTIIRHNTLIGVDAVACINAGDVTIENNLLAGGTSTIYGNRVKVINNHFSTMLYPNCGKLNLYYGGNEADLWTGNIWHETGAPAPYPHLSSAQVEEDIALNETNVTKGITLYPNPLNSNTLNIKMDGYDQANIVIYDLIGKTVYNRSHSMVEQTELQIPVDNLSNGIYIISVNGNRQKLIIE